MDLLWLYRLVPWKELIWTLLSVTQGTRALQDHGHGRSQRSGLAATVVVVVLPQILVAMASSRDQNYNSILSWNQNIGMYPYKTL